MEVTGFLHPARERLFSRFTAQQSIARARHAPLSALFGIAKIAGPSICYDRHALSFRRGLFSGSESNPSNSVKGSARSGGRPKGTPNRQVPIPQLLPPIDKKRLFTKRVLHGEDEVVRGVLTGFLDAEGKFTSFDFCICDGSDF